MCKEARESSGKRVGLGSVSSSGSSIYSLCKHSRDFMPLS